MCAQIKCKALYDYNGTAADELSFAKNAIIVNVTKDVVPMWYKGDYGGKTACFFPANYVVEVDSDGDGDELELPPVPGAIAASVADGQQAGEFRGNGMYAKVSLFVWMGFAH